MKKKKTGLHLFMAVPAFALYCVFFIYPLTKGIGMSLTNWNGYSAPEFVGLKNFVDFFHDARALHDIKTTVLFTLGSAPLLNLVGLLYALLMNSKIKGKSAARACIYMPAIISPLIMGYIWYLLLQPGRGILFTVFDRMGHPEWFGNWMGSYTTTMIVLVLVNVWQYAGMTMIIYLAGLQNISQDLYEAAMIDGAGTFARFRRITLPLLIPSIPDRRRTRLSDRDAEHLYYAHVLWQQDRIFHRRGHRDVRDRAGAGADLPAADEAERLRGAR